MKNGVPQPPLAHTGVLTESIIGVGTFNADSRGRFPGRYRLAVLEELSRVSSRMRMHGATGIDLAYVADGVLGGSISFGDHVWDHAAGVALVRAAGGVVTTLAGERVETRFAFRAGRRPRCARPVTRDAANAWDGPMNTESRLWRRPCRACHSLAWMSMAAGW